MIAEFESLPPRPTASSIYNDSLHLPQIATSFIPTAPVRWPSSFHTEQTRRPHNVAPATRAPCWKKHLYKTHLPWPPLACMPSDSFYTNWNCTSERSWCGIGWRRHNTGVVACFTDRDVSSKFVRLPHESCALQNKQKLHIVCRVNVAFQSPQVCRWGRDKLGPSCSYYNPSCRVSPYTHVTVGSHFQEGKHLPFSPFLLAREGRK